MASEGSEREEAQLTKQAQSSTDTEAPEASEVNETIDVDAPEALLALDIPYVSMLGAAVRSTITDCERAERNARIAEALTQRLLQVTSAMLSAVHRAPTQTAVVEAIAFVATPLVSYAHTCIDRLTKRENVLLSLFAGLFDAPYREHLQRLDGDLEGIVNRLREL